MKNSLLPLLLIALLTTCRQFQLDCAPPPPMLLFRLVDPQGADLSDRYRSSAAFYVISAQNGEWKLPIDSRGVQAGQVVFRSDIPTRNAQNNLTFLLDTGDGKRYPLDVVMQQSKSDCGTLSSIQNVEFNGKRVEAAGPPSGEPVYPFQIVP